MCNFTQRPERGQAMVLLILGMVGLLGFTGLALDGGALYTQRRRAQNTADNATLAAALKLAQGQSGAYVSEGMAVAAQNNYDNDGVTNQVVVINPPMWGAYSGNSGYVQTVITQTVPTSFIHLVFGGPVRLTVSAVARAVPTTPNPVVTGRAIVALDKTACESIFFSGSGDTEVNGGGIFSNSTSPGNQCYSGSKTNASGSVVVTGGGIDMVDDWDQNQNATVWPAATPNVAPITWLNVPAPDCNGSGMADQGAYSLTNGSDTIWPGRYDGISVNPAASLTMKSGLYCLTGGDFDIQGDLTGLGVTIYIGPLAGTFETNSASNILLAAATDVTCVLPTYASPATPDICDQVGLLVHVDRLNTNEVRINGGASTIFTGTFFAPSADITINGGSSTFALSSQIIGATVAIEGSGDVTIEYDPSQNYIMNVPPQIWLAERPS